MREIYLDNAATTRPFDEVVGLMVKTMKADYGNPSSLHKKGMEAEGYLRASREQVARGMEPFPGGNLLYPWRDLRR